MIISWQKLSAITGLNFNQNGDPNGGTLPVWTPYDRTSPAYMALDVQSHMQPQVTNEAVDLRVKYYCGE